MTVIGNHRLRAALIGGLTLAVVAAVGIGVANATSSGSGRWVTATATTGTVAQVYATTGSVTRKNTAQAGFTVDGTVKKVVVGVGDTVTAGQVLATLDTRSLKLAVLQAETALAQAQLSLYNAQNPSAAGSMPGSDSKTKSSGASVDLAAVSKLAGALSAAVKSESSVCDPILTWLDSDLAAATTAPSGEATASASPSPEPSASPTTEPDLAELAACGKARAQVTAANQQLQGFLKQASSAPQTSSGSTATTTVSTAQVARAKATVLSAQQQLRTATEQVAAAQLLAPITGTVGAVGLSKGDSASAGTITIVGGGDAVVSVEVPLSTRAGLHVGSPATVTAAGSLTALSGTITTISVLETNGTSGSPTFTTTISVPDASKLLASGAKASVSIPITTVSEVVTVPASAVTPTGTGTGTVSVLAAGSDTPTTTAVATGAVGGGVVEIVKGLTADTVVVLADRNAEVPSNSTRTARSRLSGSSQRSAISTGQGGSRTNR